MNSLINRRSPGCPVTRKCFTIPAPVTANRTSPASITIELQSNGAGRATAPDTVEYEQLIRPLDACFGERVGRVIGHRGLWTVEIKSAAPVAAEIEVAA
jgi:hypothetical protein